MSYLFLQTSQPMDISLIPEYKRISTTTYSVDCFNIPILNCTHYFLSHFHSDHYIGLKRSFKLKIWCSKTTSNLVKLKFKCDTNVMKEKVVYQIGDVDYVCCVDANHCPGAVMFIFKIGERFILHTGDFRCSVEVTRMLCYFDINLFDKFVSMGSFDECNGDDVCDDGDANAECDDECIEDANDVFVNECIEDEGDKCVIDRNAKCIKNESNDNCAENESLDNCMEKEDTCNKCIDKNAVFLTNTSSSKLSTNLPQNNICEIPSLNNKIAKDEASTKEISTLHPQNKFVTKESTFQLSNKISSNGIFKLQTPSKPQLNKLPTRQPLSKPQTNKTKYHSIYLDNTFEHKKQFPSQEQVIHAVLDIIRQKLNEKNITPINYKFLFCTYCIGKEKLFLSVCHYFNWSIKVEKEKMKIYRCYDTETVKRLNDEVIKIVNNYKGKIFYKSKMVSFTKINKQTKDKVNSNGSSLFNFGITKGVIKEGLNEKGGSGEGFFEGVKSLSGRVEGCNKSIKSFGETTASGGECKNVEGFCRSSDENVESFYEGTKGFNGSVCESIKSSYRDEENLNVVKKSTRNFIGTTNNEVNSSNVIKKKIVNEEGPDDTVCNLSTACRSLENVNKDNNKGNIKEDSNTCSNKGNINKENINIKEHLNKYNNISINKEHLNKFNTTFYYTSINSEHLNTSINNEHLNTSINNEHLNTYTNKEHLNTLTFSGIKKGKLTFNTKEINKPLNNITNNKEKTILKKYKKKIFIAMDGKIDKFNNNLYRYLEKYAVCKNDMKSGFNIGESNTGSIDENIKYENIQNNSFKGEDVKCENGESEICENVKRTFIKNENVNTVINNFIDTIKEDIIVSNHRKTTADGKYITGNKSTTNNKFSNKNNKSKDDIKEFDNIKESSDNRKINDKFDCSSNENKTNILNNSIEKKKNRNYNTIDKYFRKASLESCKSLYLPKAEVALNNNNIDISNRSTIKKISSTTIKTSTIKKIISSNAKTCSINTTTTNDNTTDTNNILPFDRITTEEQENQILIISTQHIAKDKLHKILQNVKCDKAVVFSGTGWSDKKYAYHWEKKDGRVIKKGIEVIHVPYSEHSSSTELEYFKKEMEYNKIIYTVKNKRKNDYDE